MLARLRTSIKRVETRFAQHLDAINRAHDSAQERRRVYREIRTAVLHIARLTRIGVRDGKIPHAVSVLPRVSTMEVSTRASVVLSNVSPYADVLEGYGLPAEVLHDLPLRLDALKTTQTDRWVAMGLHRATNGQIRRALRDGDDAIVALETSLAATHGVSRAIVLELRAARRVGRTPRRRPRAGQSRRARAARKT